MRSVGWLAAGLPVAFAFFDGIIPEDVVVPALPTRTPSPALQDGEIGALPIPRMLTAAPVARDLFKRDTRTCGYVDGNSRLSYTCHHSDAQCLYNTVASAVGCCLTSDCRIITACIPYTSSALTRTMDWDRTRYCSDPDFPHCAVYSYADKTGSLAGYVIHTCDSESATHTILFQPTGATRTGLTRTTTTEADDFFTTVDPTRTRTTEASEPTDTDDETETETDAATTTRSRRPSSTPSELTDDEKETESSTPVGAIVGGVVGGIAALGLIGLAIVIIMRKSKKDEASTVAAQSPPGAPPAVMTAIPPQPLQPQPQPQPPQQPYNQPYPPQGPAPGPGPAFTGYYDPRASMVKPDGSPIVTPQAPHMNHAPAGTPQTPYLNHAPPVSPAPTGSTVYPPPMPGQPPQAGLGIGIVPPSPSPSPSPQPMQQQQFVPYRPGSVPSPQQFHNEPIEMPADSVLRRGEVHELQGN